MGPESCGCFEDVVLKSSTLSTHFVITTYSFSKCIYILLKLLKSMVLTPHAGMLQELGSAAEHSALEIESNSRF